MNATTPPHLKWPANADHTAVPYSVFNNQEVYDLEHSPHPIEFDMYYSC